MYILGFVAAYWLLAYRQRKGLFALPCQDAVQDMLFYAFCGALIGGRLGACFLYEPIYYLTHVWEVVAVWKGGMSSHGGFAGAVVGMYLFARKNRVPLLHVIDNAVLAATPGLCLGRIGNFINAELWGRVTTVPWAVVFPTIDNQPRHPVQFYQAFAEGLLPFVVLLWVGRKKRPAGMLSGLFAMLYAALRVFTEMFREKTQVLIGLGWFGLTNGQLYSIVVFFIGVWLFARAVMKHETPT